MPFIRYRRAGQVTDDNMAQAQCILDAYVYKHTLTICNTYCFSTATIVARTRLNVTLYARSLMFILKSSTQETRRTEFAFLFRILESAVVFQVHVYVKLNPT